MKQLTLFHLTSSAPFLDEFDKQNSLLACMHAKLWLVVNHLLLFYYYYYYLHLNKILTTIKAGHCTGEYFEVPRNIINIQYFKMERYYYSPPWVVYNLSTSIITTDQNRERITTNIKWFYNISCPPSVLGSQLTFFFYSVKKCWGHIWHPPQLRCPCETASLKYCVQNDTTAWPSGSCISFTPQQFVIVIYKNLILYWT